MSECIVCGDESKFTINRGTESRNRKEAKTMKVRELLEWINNQASRMANESNLDLDVIVAFSHKGETVTSNIVSVCFNGRNIQLNEEEFVDNLSEPYQRNKYD
tara:strand:+ start:248 stop:556 length:309 start_codon:yes stop_codon:yes gene_type:complete